MPWNWGFNSPSRMRPDRSTVHHPTGSGPAGLYLHIPFCQHKCAYCDFYSTTDLALRAPFLTAMLSEIRRTVAVDLTFDTLYVGGGTPSVLAPDAIAQLVHTAQKHLRFETDPEITIEVNPGTLGSAVLSTYRQCGINRINIGVQSFDPLALKLLGRIHSTQATRAAVQEARSAGFDNIGLDLLYALPGQTEQAWRDDLKQALAFAPEHLACYMLTFEPGTPIDAACRAGELQPLDDAASRDLFDITMRVLEDHGYEHYEISNFARQGRARGASWRSRHNQKYWTFQPYIGLGPSAHSFQPPCRSWNGRDVHQYVAMIEAGRSPEAGREILTREQQLTEFIYLRLRCVDGIDWVQGQEWFGLDLHQIMASELSQFEQEGLVRIDAKRCSLTRRGMHVADSIATRLIASI